MSINVVSSRRRQRATTTSKIWIDLDNSPHVPFFLPIVRDLKERGHELHITARDCFQTCELLDLAGEDYTKIGHHYGKNPFLKVAGLLIRTAQLMRFARKHRLSVSSSHGSRSLILASWLLRVPNVNLFDYECTNFSAGLSRMPARQMMPAAIPDSRLPKTIKTARITKYHGFKEEVYIKGFQPDTGFLENLGVDQTMVIATVRPPAVEAHYHVSQSDRLFEAVVEHILSQEDALLLLLPRTKEQRDWAQAMAGRRGNVFVPEKSVNGLDLVWHSDLVISGGGTMNREAALLGVPAFSIFAGETPAVDLELTRQGRLTLLETVEDICQIQISKRDVPKSFKYEGVDAGHAIADAILETNRRS